MATQEQQNLERFNRIFELLERYLDTKSSDVDEHVWRFWIVDRESGKREYAETHLGSLRNRLTTTLEAMEARLSAQIAALAKANSTGAPVDLKAVQEAAKLGSAESAKAIAVEVLAAVETMQAALTETINNLDITDDVREALTQTIQSINTTIELKEQ